LFIALKIYIYIPNIMYLWIYIIIQDIDYGISIHRHDTTIIAHNLVSIMLY